MIRRGAYIVLLALFGLCMWPVALVFWSQRFVREHGCEFGFKMQSDGCWVDGVNMADRLNDAYSNAGVLVVTIPAAFIIFLALLVLVSVDVQRRRKKDV